MGGLHGVIPGGFLNTPVVESADYPPEFKAGFGAGEMAWGVTQIVAGGGGEVVSVALAATGGGALAGAPLSVASGAAIAEGAADVYAGLQVFRSAVSEGDSTATSDQPALKSDARFYVKPDGQTLDSETYKRNSGFRSGVRDETWTSAVEESTGRVRDPLSGRFMSKDDPWDMGHRPKMEFRKERNNAIEKWLDKDEYTSRKEFLDKMNDPSRYRPELPSSNRSHRAEDLTDDFWE